MISSAESFCVDGSGANGAFSCQGGPGIGTSCANGAVHFTACQSGPAVGPAGHFCAVGTGGTVTNCSTGSGPV